MNHVTWLGKNYKIKTLGRSIVIHKLLNIYKLSLIFKNTGEQFLDSLKLKLKKKFQWRKQDFSSLYMNQR